MALISRLATFGLLPAVWLSGYWLLQKVASTRRLPLGRLGSLCLAPALSIPLWTLALVASAQLGHFRADVWGAIGWCVCIPLSVHVALAAKTGYAERCRIEAYLAALAVIAFVLYAAYPHDSFFVGRDEATYANQALHIAYFGETTVEYPVPMHQRGLLQSAGHGYSATGMHRTADNMVIQFTPAFPIWLAVFFRSFGIVGLQSMNAVVAILSLGSFHGLAKLLLPRALALVAATFFALNPMQIWTSRITLSEICAQYLLLSGALLIMLGQRAKNGRSWVAGSILLGSAVFVRVDAFLLGPVLGAGAILGLVLGERLQFSRVHRVATACGLATLVVGVALYQATTHTYFQALYPQLGRIAALTLLSLVGWAVTELLPSRALHSLGQLIRARWAIGLLALGTAALTAYAFFVRPRLEPFSIAPNGLRDFRENSLTNLGVYLAPGLVFLSVAGALRAFWRTCIRPRQGALLWLVLLWACYTLVYVHNPSISWDHPWAMRRFVPVIMPGVILFGHFALSRLWSLRRLRTLRLPLAALLGATLLGHSAYVSLPFLFHRDYDGAYAFVTRVANSIPREKLLLCDLTTRVFGHLALGRKLKTLRFDLSKPERLLAANEVVRKNVAPGDTYYLLTDARKPLIGSQPIAEFDFVARMMQDVVEPPFEGEYREGRFHLLLYERRAPTDYGSGSLVELGLRPIQGVEESGFWGTEEAEGGPSRWTVGNASLRIPLRRGQSPTKLLMVLDGLRATGTWVAVDVNGQRLFDETVRESSKLLELALPAPPGEKLTLSILSDTFRPSDRGEVDSRVLGVRVRSIVLQ